MADYDTRYGERARELDEDRDRWNRGDRAGSGQWRRDAGDRGAQERAERDRLDRERWERESRPSGASQDEHSRYYGGTFRAGQHWADQSSRSAYPHTPDYAHGMQEDMRRYAGREREESAPRDYGPYGSLYGRDDRERSFEQGPYSRGSGYGGGYYGTGGGYFGTTGGGGFGGRGADFGSSEYGRVREFRDRKASAGRADTEGHRGATGYVGGYRDEDYPYAGGRPSARGGGERGWWDRTADEVRSWFGDDDAERRRHRDEQAGHRGRGPKGYSRSDDRIREDVSDRLTEDPHLDASEIDVTVASGEVTLAGTIENRWAKRHAEDISEGVSGVKHVQNNLRLRQSGVTSAGSTTGTGFTGQTGQTGNSPAGPRGASMAGGAAGAGGSLGGQTAGSSTASSGGTTTGRSGT